MVVKDIGTGMSEEKIGLIRRIPGFRSGTWWKMILAIIGYFFIATVLIAVIFPDVFLLP